MIRFAFTPSTIRHSVNSLFRRNKAFGGENGKRSSCDFEDWRDSVEMQAGERRTLKIGSEEYGFVWIPAGEFDMGSPKSEEERLPDEVLHRAKLTRGFWMLESPTTQALYKEIVRTTSSKFKGDDLPAETVSWDDATKFCQALSKRLPNGAKASLPTETQWEYACRAGTKTAYWFGNFPDCDKMNFAANIINKTTPVKRYAPNPWGLYDMCGNVWEWTADYYGDYPTDPVANPKGPNSGSDRVVRGGSWSDYARFCRQAVRGRVAADSRLNSLGFRFIITRD